MKRPGNVGKWRRTGALRLLAAAAVVCVCGTGEAKPVAGAAQENFGFATDQYPGFDGLDELEKPEKKDTSWFLNVSRPTAKEQLVYAREMEAAGSNRAARRGYDALVREWPASPEAPQAQLALAKIYEKNGSYDDAFDEYAYLLEFYPTDCDYAQLAAHMYQLANLMVKNKTTWFGITFTSLRQLRQNYEIVVRRAPHAEYAPDAYLKIADLRVQDNHHEEAVEVYGALMNKYPDSQQARAAAYLNASSRMWLARRLAYNAPRLRDTKNYLRMILKRYPDHEKVDELRQWLGEIIDYTSEDEWKKAKFYDSNQRTRHAAASSYRAFVEKYPESSHVDEAKARIAQIEQTRATAVRRGAADGNVEEEEEE